MTVAQLPCITLWRPLRRSRPLLRIVESACAVATRKNTRVRPPLGINLTKRRPVWITEFVFGRTTRTGILHTKGTGKVTRSGPAVCIRLWTHPQLLDAIPLL
jgi:hypothetical protein